MLIFTKVENCNIYEVTDHISKELVGKLVEYNKEYNFRINISYTQSGLLNVDFLTQICNGLDHLNEKLTDG